MGRLWLIMGRLWLIMGRLWLITRFGLWVIQICELMYRRWVRVRVR